jgi:hypothetical protein
MVRGASHSCRNVRGCRAWVGIDPERPRHDREGSCPFERRERESIRYTNANQSGLSGIRPIVLVIALLGGVLVAGLPTAAVAAETAAIPLADSSSTPSPKVPIRSCRTITKPGHYELVSNLSMTEPGGTCLVIDADHVTIDLHGHVITGGADLTATGISGGATIDVRIQNGSIRGFDNAIGLRAEHVVVSGLSLDDNNSGVLLGSYAEVRNSHFNRTHFGAALRAGDGSTLDACTFNVSDVAAVVGAGSRVTNNVSRRANQDGISAGAMSIVTGNNVFDTQDEGLRVGPQSTIMNNNSFGNGEADLLITCPSNVIGNAAGDVWINQPGQQPCNLSDNMFLEIL